LLPDLGIAMRLAMLPRADGAHSCPIRTRKGARPCCHICTGTGLTPCPICTGKGARPCRICTGTGLSPATSAPGLGSPLPHLRRDGARPCLPQLHWDCARPCHMRAGTGLAPACHSCTGTGRLAGSKMHSVLGIIRETRRRQELRVWLSRLSSDDAAVQAAALESCLSVFEVEEEVQEQADPLSRAHSGGSAVSDASSSHSHVPHVQNMHRLSAMYSRRESGMARTGHRRASHVPKVKRAVVTPDLSSAVSFDSLHPARGLEAQGSTVSEHSKQEPAPPRTLRSHLSF
jgi:hypothetical protein